MNCSLSTCNHIVHTSTLESSNSSVSTLSKPGELYFNKPYAANEPEQTTLLTTEYAPDSSFTVISPFFIKQYLQRNNISIQLPQFYNDYQIIVFRLFESRICIHSWELGCGCCTEGPILKKSYWKHIRAKKLHKECYELKHQLNQYIEEQNSFHYCGWN